MYEQTVGHTVFFKGNCTNRQLYKQTINFAGYLKCECTNRQLYKHTIVQTDRKWNIYGIGQTDKRTKSKNKVQLTEIKMIRSYMTKALNNYG